MSVETENHLARNTESAYQAARSQPLGLHRGQIYTRIREPFFFDWFARSDARALAGPRAALYAEPAFAEFRERLAAYEADRPERLADAYFAGPEPEELLYDQIEALWAPITETDDWSAFHLKLARIEVARVAWGFSS